VRSDEGAIGVQHPHLVHEQLLPVKTHSGESWSILSRGFMARLIRYGMLG
jgi:hypothetical protein